MVTYKVQAEVDVAIAIYLIDYANHDKVNRSNSVSSITLFAGDRDFIDAIEYTK